MRILDKFRLCGKKVLITGGSKGIGKVGQLSKCLAVEWADHNCRRRLYPLVEK